MSTNTAYFLNLVELYLTKRITAEQHHELKELLDKHEQHRLFFDQVVKSTLAQSNVDTAFKKLQQHKDYRTTIKKSIFFKYQLWKYAAAIILISFLVATGIYMNREPSQHNTVTYEAPIGKRLQYTLPDGTQIWLNGGSSLKLDDKFGLKDRNVQLEGEAFFDVAHDAQKPFLVHADQLHIKVLGTTFNVRAYSDEILRETTLLTGKVELTIEKDKSTDATSQPTYKMVPGERLSINKNTLPSSANKDLIVNKEVINEQEILHSNTIWKDNILVFDNDPMSYVKSKLEKWYGVKIDIRNEKLLHHHFSGKFKESSIEEVLSLLKETGGIKTIRKEQQTIIIE